MSNDSFTVTCHPDQAGTPTPAPGRTLMPQLRTVAICDIADSTALVERLGDRRASELFRRHDRLARDLLQRHGGREIDKTDGFLVLFDRPIHAVGFALDYQRALRDLGAEERIVLTARVGIHVGDVVLYENAAEDIAHGAKRVEVEGLAKPVAARLMQLARPGQILLSGMAQTLAQRSQGDLGLLATRVRWHMHGRYRFKGVPAPMLVHEVGELEVAPLKPPPSSSKAQRELPLWRQPRTLLVEGAVALLGVIALVAALTTRPTPAIAFAERDWVVMGDLRNLTGDDSVGAALDAAFRISLEQSRFVNVVSDLRLRRVLDRMHRDPETAIDRDTGSEIALREGARALILPTVADVGGRIRVSAEVIDPNTQTTVFAHSADGDGMKSALASLDQVAVAVRDRLGEAMRDIQNDSSPLPEVTTANLGALRIFAEAQRSMYSGKLATALDLYSEATRLDPEFALAWLGVAKIHIGGDDLVAAREALAKAAAHRDRLATREALVLEAFELALGPPGPLLEKWKLVGTLYPDYFPAYYNFALFAWEGTNDFAGALAYADKGRSPHNTALGPLNYLLGTLSLGLERYEEASAYFGQAEALDGAGLGLVPIELQIALRRHAEAGERLAHRRLSGVQSKDASYHSTAVSLAVDSGNWTHARRALEQAAGELRDAGASHSEVMRVHATVLAAYEAGALQDSLLADELGRLGGVIATADPVHRPTIAYAALVIAYVGARKGATQAARGALAYSMDAVQAAQAGPLDDLRELVKAEIALQEGQAHEALQRLRSRAHDTAPLLLQVGLADAQIASGDLDGAATTLAALSERRGRALTERLATGVTRVINLAEVNLALLRLAETLHALGRNAEARAALDSFARAWPDPHRPKFATTRIERLRSALQASTPASGDQ